MASTVAMAGLTASSSTQQLLQAPHAPSRSTKPGHQLLQVRANLQQQESSRRGFLSLLASSIPATAVLLAGQETALAAATSIKVGGPPPLSGGLPGTENADQARDTDLPLKERFYLQALPPSEAIARAKESAKDIVAVKALIDKKAWPYVQNDLRLKASYLRFDINTVLSSKSKDEKKALKPLVAKLFLDINDLDYAARSKNVDKAQQYYNTTVSSLNDLLAKLG